MMDFYFSCFMIVQLPHQRTWLPFVERSSDGVNIVVFRVSVTYSLVQDEEFYQTCRSPSYL